MAADPKNRGLLEGWAKEDARYCLPLATETQLGMTVNARNVELMIRRLAASPLAEAREYSRRLYEATHVVAPSLVRYTEPTPYDLETTAALRAETAGILGHFPAGASDSSAGQAGTDLVRLVDVTPEADEKVLAAIAKKKGVP